jgi:CRISPR-associated exonuclease Cas4
LIEANFKGKVTKGFLVYTRSSNKLIEVAIDEKAKEEIKDSMRAMAEIITKNHFPKATKFKQRCLNCTYRNICIQ